MLPERSVDDSYASPVSITHIDRRYLNNHVESGHAALKRLLGYRQNFRSLRSAKAIPQVADPPERSRMDMSIQSNRASGAKLPSPINCLD
ncbi:DDE-type integrase/transposase/recombinase [Lentibacter sp. XHP0401]|uniref:DDE-type integrase/transposase/recombinase n=1 Tax=Lentibacter sp. XHP0401 TaxID=2984334 RepID=UPI00399431B7